MFKNIVGRVYFIYGMLLFAITMIPVAIIFFIAKNTLPEKKASYIVQRGFQIWMGIYMPLIFCPVTHRGRDNFKKGQNYVVTLNHNTLADVPVSSPGIPGPNRTLAKVEMSKIPIFGYIYKAGSILVTRQDASSRKESIPKMLEALHQGLHLCLFPEGTRNKTDQPLARFYDGAFKVAIEAQKPIIPGLIFGTKAILDSNKKMWAWPHKVEFHFLPEISTAGLQQTDTEMLKQKVFEVMKAYYLQHQDLV
ncbi:MAG TPA: lysophospholipid acyltransferase family protein [Chitinophagaceae bacterium]|nr:lysophospholipid acyltransferase family protein [Chitinophagaceae bacterium]